MLMLGMLGQLAGLAVMMPITLGAGALLGARQVIEDRKRQIERRRQEARTIVRQFIAEAQDETLMRVRQAATTAHRILRDHFATEIRHLSETTTNTIRSLQASLQADDAERQSRLAALHETAGRVDSLINRARELSGNLREPE
jgi:hypothetical protein